MHCIEQLGNIHHMPKEGPLPIIGRSFSLRFFYAGSTRKSERQTDERERETTKIVGRFSDQSIDSSIHRSIPSPVEVYEEAVGVCVAHVGHLVQPGGHQNLRVQNGRVYHRSHGARIAGVCLRLPRGLREAEERSTFHRHGGCGGRNVHRASADTTQSP